MNTITIIAWAICPICLLVALGMLIYGYVKYRKLKKKKKEQLGYNAVTTSQQVNHIKTKANKQYELGCIPLGLALAYDDINKDSSVKYVKFLNKLTKKYLKKKRYYKRRPNEDLYASNSIMNQVAEYFARHKDEHSHQKLDTCKVFRECDYNIEHNK